MLAFWSCPDFREIYRRENVIARVQQSRIAVRRQSCPFSSIYYFPWICFPLCGRAGHDQEFFLIVSSFLLGSSGRDCSKSIPSSHSPVAAPAARNVEYVTGTHAVASAFPKGREDSVGWRILCRGGGSGRHSHGGASSIRLK